MSTDISYKIYLSNGVSEIAHQSILANMFARAHNGTGDEYWSKTISLSELKKMLGHTVFCALNFVRSGQELGYLNTDDEIPLVRWSEKDDTFIHFSNKTRQTPIERNNGHVQFTEKGYEVARRCFIARDLEEAQQYQEAKVLSPGPFKY